MDPKKVVILILLLVGLVVAGRWACAKYHHYNPEPQGVTGYGGYGGYGKAAKGDAPASPAATVAPGAAPTVPPAE